MSRDASSERWRHIYELAEAALEIPAAARADFVRSRIHDSATAQEVLELAAELEKSHDSPSRIGTFLGRFELTAHLGAGGSGDVYVARDPELDRNVAIKILKSEGSDFLSSEGRFLREARTASALNHPNIVTIYEILRADPILGIVMELVDGVSLRELCGAPVALPKLLGIAQQAASALSAAHAAGIIHRDIKPENIMIDGNDRVRILDFGLARRAVRSGQPMFETQRGLTAGTLRYMTPEHYKGDSITAASDIFALGLVLYELSTGHHPFPVHSALEVLHAIATENPPPSRWSAVPQLLEETILAMLSKEAARRPSASNVASTMRQIENAPHSKSIVAVPSAHSTRKTVVVLPFVNFTGDVGDEAFSDGLTEEIINVLAQIPELNVIARTSAFAFKGRNQDIREIARALGVDHLVEGSVRRAGSRVRVTVQVIRASDGVHILSKRHDCELTDIFAVQDSIASDVASQLQVGLHLYKRYVPKVAAYEAFLEGRYHWHHFTADGFKKALVCFERAVALDPAYSRPHAGIAEYWIALASECVQPPIELLPHAKEAAERALSLDETDGEAHAALATVFALLEYRWNEAREHFLRARELTDTLNVRINYIYWYLIPQRCLDEALAECDHLLESDPLLLVAHCSRASVLSALGKFEDAATSCLRALEIHPDFILGLRTLLHVRGCQRQGEDALKLGQRIWNLRRGDPFGLEALAAGKAVAGDREGALLLTEELLRTPTGENCANRIAMVHAALGDREQAIYWQDKAIAIRDCRTLWMRTVPWFDLIHSDPRYTAMLSAMRLE